MNIKLTKISPVVSIEQIKELGWSIASQTIVGTEDTTVFAKGNYRMVMRVSKRTHEDVVEIIAVDEIPWMNYGDFRIIMKCPTIGVLKILTENL